VGGWVLGAGRATRIPAGILFENGLILIGFSGKNDGKSLEKVLETGQRGGRWTTLQKGGNLTYRGGGGGGYPPPNSSRQSTRGVQK